MKIKTNLWWSLPFACLLITPSAQGQEPLKAVVTDLCASPRFEEIIAAIECKRKGCPDPDGGKDALYARACTEVDPEAANAIPVIASRDDGNFNSQRTVLRRINDSYELIEALEVTRVEKPIKMATLSPCDCLAKIAAKTQCKVELCPKETQAPPAENPPTQGEARPELPEKDITPEKADASLQGGSICALSQQVLAPGSQWAWLALLGLGGLWLWGRRRAGETRG